MASKYFDQQRLISLINQMYPTYFIDRILAPKTYSQHEEQRENILKEVREGKGEAINQIISSLSFKDIFRYSVVAHYSATLNFTINTYRDGVVVVKATLPGKEIIPIYNRRVLKSGRVSLTPKPKKQLNEEYRTYIADASHWFSNGILQFIPTVKKIYFSGYVDMIHPSKGHHYDACIISYILDVDQYDQLLIENLNSDGVLSNFQLRFNWDREFEISETTPHLYVSDKAVESKIDLDRIDPIAFEELIKNLLNKMGLVAETTQASHDGGIDVVAVSSNPITGGRFVVQCKRYKHVVSVDIIRDLYGAMTSERASKGILITTSDFSTDGVKFAQGKPIELINRKRLSQLLEDYGFKVAAKM